MGGQAGGRKKLIWALSQKPLRCKMSIGRDLGLGYMHAVSWCDFDLTFDLAIMTLTFKIMSGLYVENCKV